MGLDDWKDKADETADNMKDKAGVWKEKAEGVWEDTKDKSGELADQAKGKVDEMRHGADDKIDDK